MIAASLRDFARLLGLRPDLADDALRSERAAKAVLSRRNLFAAGAALAASAAFSFPAEQVYRCVYQSGPFGSVMNFYVHGQLVEFMGWESVLSSAEIGAVESELTKRYTPPAALTVIGAPPGNWEVRW